MSKSPEEVNAIIAAIKEQMRDGGWSEVHLGTAREHHKVGYCIGSDGQMRVNMEAELFLTLLRAVLALDGDVFPARVENLN